MGNHLLLEVYDVNFEAINNIESLQNAMINGIERAKMVLAYFSFLNFNMFHFGK
jgi:S-adenosylmethionine/arginine decarboxylase-like enzyme